jgi:phage protein D
MLTYIRVSKLLAGAAAALLSIGLLAAGALAVTSPDQTREGYAAQVEPICKVNAKFNERILSSARKNVKQGKLAQAAKQLAQAAASSATSVKQIKAVPQPVADASKLKKWIGYLEDEQALLAEIGKALKAGKKARAQTLAVKLTHNGNLANNTVLGFEFNYCLIDTSKFT